MGGTPDLLFVIDVNKEDLAILEAQKLGIPVIAVVDTNSLAQGRRLRDPGQRRRGPRHLALLRPDRARGPRRHERADGRAGIDIGSMEEAPVEEVPADEAGA